MRTSSFIYLIIIIGLYGCKANPDDLKSERNFLKGIELSKLKNKPIFINFTGYGCIGYNEFYLDLLTSKKVLRTLNEKYVTIELYVDTPKKIEKSDTLNLHKIVFSKEEEEKIKKANTLGQINSAIQRDWLKVYYQPLYLIIDSERNILVEPFGYTGRNEKFFIEKLEEGLNKFEKNKNGS